MTPARAIAEHHIIGIEEDGLELVCKCGWRDLFTLYGYHILDMLTLLPALVVAPEGEVVAEVQEQEGTLIATAERLGVSVSTVKRRLAEAERSPMLPRRAEYRRVT